MARKERAITEGVIWKEMIAFFMPIMLGTLLQQVYNMADTIILSHYVGKLALAAVGGSDISIIWLLVNAFVALSSGASVVISQHYGAGNQERLEKAVHTAIWLAVICGTIVTFLGVFGGPVLLRWLGTKEELMEYSVDYLVYYFMGMVPSLLYNMGSGILRAVGDSKKPLYFLAICAATNIVLDLLFVGVFHMEVAGAAIATTLSQVISAVLVLVSLMRTKDVYRLDIHKLKITKQEMQMMLKIGIPAMAQSLMYNICNVMIQAAINMLTTDTVAAWSVFWKLDGIYWPISNAIGIAVMTFVGQNYGAGKKQRIRKSIKTGFILHLAFSFLFATILIVGKRVWLSAFISDESVIEIAIQIILYLAPAYVCFCGTEVLSSSLRGVGKSITAMLLTMIGICVVRIIYLYTVVFQNPSNLVISLTYPISWTFASVEFIIYTLASRWIKKLPIPED